MNQVAKTSVEYDTAKLERVKAVLGTRTFKDSIDRAWDLALGLAAQHALVDALVADPVDLERVDGPGVVLRTGDGPR